MTTVRGIQYVTLFFKSSCHVFHEWDKLFLYSVRAALWVKDLYLISVAWFLILNEDAKPVYPFSFLEVSVADYWESLFPLCRKTKYSAGHISGIRLTPLLYFPEISHDSADMLVARILSLVEIRYFFYMGVSNELLAVLRSKRYQQSDILCCSSAVNDSRLMSFLQNTRLCFASGLLFRFSKKSSIVFRFFLSVSVSVSVSVSGLWCRLFYLIHLIHLTHLIHLIHLTHLIHKYLRCFRYQQQYLLWYTLAFRIYTFRHCFTTVLFSVQCFQNEMIRDNKQHQALYTATKELHLQLNKLPNSQAVR